MTSNRYPILKTDDGKKIFCSHPGCYRAARHIHHMQPRCEGGTDEYSNLQYMCQRCHVKHHSANGDFSRWGSIGGQKTAATGKSVPNLKQFQGEAGYARWVAYCEKKAAQQIGLVQ